MTDSTVEPADFSVILVERAHAEEAERQRNIRRAIAAAAVLLIHVVALGVIVYGVRMPILERVRQTVPEAIWVLMPKPAAQPKPRVETPQPLPQQEVLPQVTAPITLPPVRPQPLAPPESGGLAGVGRSLSCGASLYENLPAYLRDQCRRHPWAHILRSDGTIVMDTGRPDAPPAFTAGDIMRHEQQTAPACPPLINVPCLSKILPNRDPVTNGSMGN